ncbi:uncharacterized protein LOC134179165 [Corticium candelabrum]|uniref:uncharacterized protein LOC134179165 n=1 Tax=Corticium candelabrum TaxID=121492 RepID=UPI002E25CEC4|nr:uncharacterized protein LOC134179165 [Corticium candelabrum]
MASNVTLSSFLEFNNITLSSALSLCLDREVPESIVTIFISLCSIIYLLSLTGSCLFLVAVIASHRLHTYDMAMKSLLCVLLLVYGTLLSPLIAWHVTTRGALFLTNPALCQVFGFSRMLFDLFCLFTFLILIMESLSGVIQPLKHKVTFMKLLPQVFLSWLFAVSISLVSLKAGNGQDYLQYCRHTGLCGLDLSDTNGLVIVFFTVSCGCSTLFVISCAVILYFVRAISFHLKHKNDLVDVFFNQGQRGNLQSDICTLAALRHKLEYSVVMLCQQAISTVISVAVYYSCLWPIYIASLVMPSRLHSNLSGNTTCNVCSMTASGDSGDLSTDNVMSSIISSQPNESVICNQITHYGVSPSSQPLSFFFMLLLILPAAIIPYILALTNPNVIEFYNSKWQRCRLRKSHRRVQPQLSDLN